MKCTPHFMSPTHVNKELNLINYYLPSKMAQSAHAAFISGRSWLCLDSAHVITICWSPSSAISNHRLRPPSTFSPFIYWKIIKLIGVWLPWNYAIQIEAGGGFEAARQFFPVKDERQRTSFLCSLNYDHDRVRWVSLRFASECTEPRIHAQCSLRIPFVHRICALTEIGDLPAGMHRIFVTKLFNRVIYSISECVDGWLLRHAADDIVISGRVRCSEKTGKNSCVHNTWCYAFTTWMRSMGKM